LDRPPAVGVSAPRLLNLSVLLQNKPITSRVVMMDRGPVNLRKK